MEITIDLMLKMASEAQVEVESFRIDTYENLLNKFRQLREQDDFIEASILKQLNVQIENVIKAQETARGHKSVLEIMLEISNHQKKEG